MASVHEGWITELMGSLDGAERATLYDLLSTMKRGLRPVEPLE
jgi:hypothetical protein